MRVCVYACVHTCMCACLVLCYLSASSENVLNYRIGLSQDTLSEQWDKKPVYVVGVATAIGVQSLGLSPQGKQTSRLTLLSNINKACIPWKHTNTCLYTLQACVCVCVYIPIYICMYKIILYTTSEAVQMSAWSDTDHLYIYTCLLLNWPHSNLHQRWLSI